MSWRRRHDGGGWWSSRVWRGNGSGGQDYMFRRYDVVPTVRTLLERVKRTELVKTQAHG